MAADDVLEVVLLQESVRDVGAELAADAPLARRPGGKGFNRLFCPEKWPQFWPEIRPKEPFEQLPILYVWGCFLDSFLLL